MVLYVYMLIQGYILIEHSMLQHFVIANNVVPKQPTHLFVASTTSVHVCIMIHDISIYYYISKVDLSD